MAHRFDEGIVSAVLHHMNDDHLDDNVLIARAFGGWIEAEVATATMTGFDGAGGTWRVGFRDGSEELLSVAWRGGEITERPEVRREIVALYDEACRLLGLEPRPHS